MKFMVLIYNDTAMLDTMPATEFDSTMRSCIEHADDLRKQGYLLESQQLESVGTAKSVRVRKNRLTITDGPFSETKEVLGGFNLIEAEKRLWIGHGDPREREHYRSARTRRGHR